MKKVDIFSDTIDPSVTIDFLKTIRGGDFFPKIQGVATANYAHQQFPDLPLDEAVRAYIIERDRTPSPTPPFVPTHVYEFIKECDGVRCVGWDDDRLFHCFLFFSLSSNFSPNREGWLICTVDDPRSNYAPRRHWNLKVDFSFDVSSVAEAKRVARKILRVVRRYHPVPTRKSIPRKVKAKREKTDYVEGQGGAITGLHFSGCTVFVTRDVCG